MIEPGTYTGRAKEIFWKESKNGNIYCGVMFEVDGEKVFWNGHFTEKTRENSIRTLAALGCRMANRDAFDVEGFDANEVTFEVMHEADQNGELRARAGFINGIGSSRKEIPAEKMDAFREQMKFAIADVLGDTAQPKDDNSDIPF